MAAANIGARRLFALWAALVLACGLWNSICSCSTRARARAVAACPAEPPVCLSWETVKALSPRWLSDGVGSSGPIVSWLFLVPLLRATGRTALLADVILWYLAFIMPVRYLHLVVPPGWGALDPSGHVFVYGAQLVPVWLAAQLGHGRRGPWERCALHNVALHCAYAYALVLVYLSAATAAFFHTLSESACALAIVTLPFGAHERTLGVRAVWTSHRTAALLLIAWLVQTLAVWRALRAQSDASESARAVARLKAQAAYDCTLWIGLHLSLRVRRSSGGAVGDGAFEPLSSGSSPVAGCQAGSPE
jgi:hypothetical protein